MGYNKITALESEEEKTKRLAKEQAANSKTLWEQLEERKQQKQDEYDAVTKMMNGAC